jgi:hypothetical protein
LAFSAAGGSFFLLFGNHQTNSGSGIEKAPQDESDPYQHVIASQTESGSKSTKALKEIGPYQPEVISQTGGGSDGTKALKDQSGTHQRMVIAVPGDKTVAE